jgi:hypothetical protein
VAEHHRDQLDAQPGFFNDCKAFGSWMAERESDPAIRPALERLGATAIATFRTEGVEDDEVEWVSPDELARAAARLREAVLGKHPDTARILATYAVGANEVDPVDVELAQDLADIAAMCEWARAEGATRVTLDVNW